MTALMAGGEEIAVLVHDPALLDEPGVVDSVRATAGLVLENERLAAEVRSQLAEVRASRGRIVAAADTERRRIERNLHDGAQQRLVALSMALGLEASRADADAPRALARTGRDRAGDRRVARARAWDPPDAASGRGTPGRGLLARPKEPAPGQRSRARPARIPDGVALAAYFVVAEGLTNIGKHASATEATVAFEQQDGRLRVTVSDDGIGGAGSR